MKFANKNEGHQLKRIANKLKFREQYAHLKDKKKGKTGEVTSESSTQKKNDHNNTPENIGTNKEKNSETKNVFDKQILQDKKPTLKGLVPDKTASNRLINVRDLDDKNANNNLKNETPKTGTKSFTPDIIKRKVNFKPKSGIDSVEESKKNWNITSEQLGSKPSNELQPSEAVKHQMENQEEESYLKKSAHDKKTFLPAVFKHIPVAGKGILDDADNVQSKKTMKKTDEDEKKADGPIQKTKNRNYTIEHVIEHEYVIANMGKLKDDSKGNLKDKQSYKQSNGTYISHVIENHLIEVKNKKIIKVEKSPLRYM